MTVQFAFVFYLNFFIQYIFILFPSPNLSRFSPPPYPLHGHSLSLKNGDRKARKQTNKQKAKNETNKKKHGVNFLCWPTTPGQRPVLECGWYGIPLKKTDFPALSKYQLLTESWLGRDFAPTSTFQWRELVPVLVLLQSWVHVCIHPCVFLKSPPLLSPPPSRSLILGGWGVMKMPHLEPSAPESFTLCCGFLC